jgi:anti-sigma-K factor RskA
MSDTTQDFREQAPAYVLGALSAEEARAFEAVLARDPELQREVAEFREVTAMLATGESMPPPPELKHRLLERVRADKSVPLPVARPSRRSMMPTLLGLGLAASVILSASLALQVGRLERDLNGRDSLLTERESRLAARERTLNSILEPGVELTLLSATGAQAPGMQVFRDRNRNIAIIHGFRLKPAPAGRTYQLWIIPKGGKPIPSQVFNADPDGRVLVENVAVPTDISIEAYAITEEPAGGSPQPTSTPFLVGRVAAP